MAPTPPVLDPQTDPTKNSAPEPGSAGAQPSTPAQPDLESAKTVIDRAYQSPPDSGSLNPLDQISPSADEPTEQPGQNQPNPLKERLQAEAKKHNEAIAQRVEDAKTKTQRLGGEGLKTGEKSAAKAAQAGERAAAQTARAAARATGEATKAAAKAAGRAASQVGRVIIRFLAGTIEIWGPIVLVIIVVLIIIAIVFAILGLSGGQGNGPAILPSSVSQQQQATLLSALSGDKIANDQVVKKVIQDEKDRYQRIKKNADKYDSQFSGAIASKVTEFGPKLDALIQTKNKAERLKLRDELEKQMLAFEGGLPFGNWITKFAQSHLKQDSLNFCKITGAGATVACASFVSTTLWEAGVPDAIVGTTTEIWTNKALRLVVDRPNQKSAQTWDNNKNKLQKGDVIWWGDGNCSKVSYSGKLFDHVGIYIGDGNTINNSSSKKDIEQGSANKRSSCLLFNGAKRYGANL